MDSKRFLALASLVIILTILAAGCSNATTTAVVPQPAATSSIPTAPVPQTSSDSGAIKVTLFSIVTGKPLTDGMICLATLIKLSGNVEGYIPSLNSKTSPCGNTDANGTLVISNIKPAKYGLVFSYPIGAHELMKLEGSDKEISIDIAAGNILDMGTIKVQTDPNKMQ